MKTTYTTIKKACLLGIAFFGASGLNTYAGFALYVSGGTLYVDGDLKVDGDGATGDTQIASGGTINLGTAAANLRTASLQVDGTLSGNSASTITVSGGSISGTVNPIVVPGNLTAAGSFSLSQNVNVTTTTTLAGNLLTLNAKTFGVLATATNALTATAGTGGVVGGTTTLTGGVKWATGVSATYVFPMATAAGTDVRVTATTDGTEADLTVSTYATADNNTPFTSITHAGGLGTAEAVNRYWQFAMSGSGSPNLVLTYAQTEAAVMTDETVMTAELGNSGTQIWDEATVTTTSADATANTVTMNNFAGFGSPILLARNGGTAIGSAPAPVELTHFEANCNDGQVLIKWTTASEINNHGFEIERSLDNSFVIYSKVADQYLNQAEANSAVPKDYMAIDQYPLAATAYYRIKQIDNNDAYEYHDAVAVTPCGTVNGFDITSAVSNSEDQSIVITFNTEASETVYYTLIDYRGQRVSEKSIVANSGANQVKISTAGVNKGIYLLSIKNKQKTVTDKIVVQ